MRDENVSVPLWNKYSLSIQEAAAYYGIGEKKLRQLIAEHEGEDFILEIGAHVRIKRIMFEKYLDEISVV